MDKLQIDNREIIGFLFILGSLQVVLSLMIAEGLAENYDSQLHYISTLGSRSVAWIFNLTVFIFGICILITTYFLYKEYNKTLPSSLLLLTAFCAIGVGLFPEGNRPWHGIFTGFLFIFAVIFLISVINLERSHLLIFISIFGIFTLLVTLIFFPYLGLDVESNALFYGLFKGTLERIIIYLNLCGFLILGGFFTKNKSISSPPL